MRKNFLINCLLAVFVLIFIIQFTTNKNNQNKLDAEYLKNIKQVNISLNLLNENELNNNIQLRIASSYSGANIGLCKFTTYYRKDETLYFSISYQLNKYITTSTIDKIVADKYLLTNYLNEFYNNPKNKKNNQDLVDFLSQ